MSYRAVSGKEEDLSLALENVRVGCPPSHPLPNTHTELTDLRGEKEKLLSDIEQLQNEKAEIEDALPALLDKLMSVHTEVEEMHEERKTYDSAIQDMLSTYSMILEGGPELLDQPFKMDEDGEGGEGEEEEEDEEAAYQVRDYLGWIGGGWEVREATKLWC